MDIYQTLDNVKKNKLTRPIVTWGIFDGVHLGHIELITENVNLANRTFGHSVIITFENHPEEVLFNRKIQFITSLEHRLKLLDELNVDVCIVLRFDNKLAEITAQEFLMMLRKKIGMKGIIASNLTRFGKNNLGNINTLKKFAAQNFIYLKLVEPVKVNNKVVSSTLVRNLITNGNLDEAKNLLGRFPSTYGTVIKGTGIGKKKLGIATANIDVHSEIVPPNGVYATITILADKENFSITNIGTRPTIDPANKQIHIETHIFDVKKKLYGEDIEIKFIKKLRGEKKFPSLSALKKQILIDKKKALKILRAYRNQN